MVESAVVIGVFLLIIFGLLDVGLLVLHNNCLAEAARRLAREAIVRGSTNSDESVIWGPAQLTGNAGENTVAASSIEDVLIALPLQGVQYVVEWPDGTNDSDDRVQVTLNYEHHMMVPFLFGDGVMELNAVSTMRIEH